MGAPAPRRAASALAAPSRENSQTDFETAGPGQADPADAYLNADNGWPATGNDAAALQSEYDALADLFLNDEAEVSPAPASGRSQPVNPTFGQPPTTARTPAATAAPGAPVAPVAKATPANATWTGSKGAQTLKSGVGAPPVGTRELPSQGIDCLILGHLPVLASAWSLQYARAAAERTGMPVALVRLSSGSVSIEVIFASPEQAVTLRAGGPTANFENALDRARAVAPRLMLRVDETSELDVLSSGQAIDRVAVLCSADDMAVVATYRTIKHLVSNPTLGLGGDAAAHEEPTSLGVAIMGAENGPAADAISRLNRATQTFLGRPVSYLACIPRMGPCSTSSLYRGEWTRSARALVEELAELWGTKPLQDPTAADFEPPTVEAIAEPTRATTAPEIHVRRGIEASPPVRQQGERPMGERPRENPAPAVTPPGAAMISGLRPLVTKSPYTPTVELACDQDGALHLVATLTGTDATAAYASEGVGKLLAVASWASDHAELLALAHPQLDAAAINDGPSLHLITDDPRAARGVLSTGVRVHMVTTVTVQGRANWVCNPLN